MDENDLELLSKYDEELGLKGKSKPLTIASLIRSHKSQREIVSQYSEESREYRQNAIDAAVAAMYRDCDVGRIIELKEHILEELDAYIADATAGGGSTESKVCYWRKKGRLFYAQCTGRFWKFIPGKYCPHCGCELGEAGEIK